MAAKIERVGIAGSCRSGKTTLSAQYPNVLHTDDFIGLGWSGASEEVCRLLLQRSHDTYEGVALLRALRKALRSTQDKPLDRLIYLQNPREALSVGQRAMNSGSWTVFQEINAELRRRGVVISVE